MFVPVMGLPSALTTACSGRAPGLFPGRWASSALFGLGATRAAGQYQGAEPHLEPRRTGAVHPIGRRASAPVAGGDDRAQIVGGYLGALTGIRFGAKLIRPLVVVVLGRAGRESCWCFLRRRDGRTCDGRQAGAARRFRGASRSGSRGPGCDPAGGERARSIGVSSIRLIAPRGGHRREIWPRPQRPTIRSSTRVRTNQAKSACP